MNRERRIEAARVRVWQLEPWKKRYDDAVAALKAAEASYDIGERVHVKETCRRGCCTEFECDGVIVGRTANGCYLVNYGAKKPFQVLPTYMRRIA